MFGKSKEHGRCGRIAIGNLWNRQFLKKKTVIIIKIWLPCNRSACVHRVMKFLGILKNTEDAEGLLQATREFANF